jgi:hypothetical protein
MRDHVEALCDQKIALSEKIDLRPVIEAYAKAPETSD